MTLWVCRAGKNGEYENRFLEDNCVYCTWNDLPNSLLSYGSRKELQEHFEETNPGIKPKTALNWAGQVWNFSHGIKEGDIIALPSKIQPTIHFGEIVGGYDFVNSNDIPYQHSHKVKWVAKDVPKSLFDESILYSFGSLLTIFKLKQELAIKKVVDKFLSGKTIKSDSGELPELEPDKVLDVENEALNEISDMLIRKTKGHKMATLIDGILRAQGFSTYVSPPGPDYGVDILASSGLLGFGSPKICVQVKTTDAPVDRPTLNQLVGTMKTFGAEYGLLVSWSGFKNSVMAEIPKEFFNIRFWSHKEIMEQFLKYYEVLDPEIKEMIPLKKIWILDDQAD